MFIYGPFLLITITIGVNRRFEVRTNITLKVLIG